MNRNTLKDILMPIGVIFTACPIGLGLMALIAYFWGPLAIVISIFAIGVASLTALLIMERNDKRKAAGDSDEHA